LFPKASDPEAFSELCLRCLSDDALARVFDSCQMGRLVEAQGRRASPPTSLQKASMLKAVVCELFWFCERTRANDRTHNNALFPPSDVLILHVLAAHVVEALSGEMVFSQIEPIASAARQRAWPRFSESQVHQVLKLSPKTPAAMSLADGPRPFEEGLDGLRGVSGAPEDLAAILPRAAASDADDTRTPLWTEEDEE